MPRSLGSVFGYCVARYLGRGLRGVVRRSIATPSVTTWCNGVAVSRDGTTLFVSDSWNCSHSVSAFGIVDGERLRVVGGAGDGPLHFQTPAQVCVAPDDGAVFVADSDNHRVQVLAPDLSFVAFFADGELDHPQGVCVNADYVVASQDFQHSLAVYTRAGDFLRHIGHRGTERGALHFPRGVCFTADDEHVAVADGGNQRVSVFHIGGAFQRHVGTGVLGGPCGVACSAADELVVADRGATCVWVFDTDGSVMHCLGRGGIFTGVVVLGATVLACDSSAWQCVVFK
jgi:DNA-binding beta-propeller fold protein YncE